MPGRASSPSPGPTRTLAQQAEVLRRRALSLAGRVVGRWPRPRPRVVALVVAACLAGAAASGGGWWWVRVHDPLTTRLDTLAQDPQAALDWLAPQEHPDQDDQAQQDWQPSPAALARWQDLGTRQWGSQGLTALTHALAATTQLRSPHQDTTGGPSVASSGQAGQRAAWATAQGLDLLAAQASRIEPGARPALTTILASCLDDLEQATGHASRTTAWDQARPPLLPADHSSALLALTTTTLTHDTGLETLGTLLDAAAAHSTHRLQAVITTHPGSVLGHDEAFDTEIDQWTAGCFSVWGFLVVLACGLVCGVGGGCVVVGE